MYTVESLSKINSRFLNTHFEIINADVDRVNTCINLVEKSRNIEKPMVGDIVQYTDEYGDYFAHAVIEKVKDREAYIAESGNMYLDLDKESEHGFFASVSCGGAFHYIPIKKMVYTKKQEERSFWHFGHCGACADGGIDFYAKVNVWECNLNEQKYSTKTHEKHYVSYREHPEQWNSRYHFSNNNGKAWEKEKDFQAWLRTFRGVVESGNWKNQLIVWTYKNIEHHVSPSVYETVNGIEDTFLMNAKIRKCKRIYDDKNYIVHTYYVWYWEDSEALEKDFYKRLSEQNKVIDNYVLDWRLHKANEYARKELENGTVQPIDLKPLWRK